MANIGEPIREVELPEDEPISWPTPVEVPTEPVPVPV